MKGHLIKKGVTPYGGRRVEVLSRFTDPKGREWVEVSLGKKKLSIAHDVRLYRADEIEEAKNA